jgi:DNA-binding GntR family transcriptional regulator
MGVIIMKKSNVQSQTLQIQVYEYLHDKIISGEIPPGKRVVEQKIVEETGISRSPVREAIRRLANEGLVTVHPRGGVRVYRATSSDFKYLFECRIGLEPTAAFLASKRMNNLQRNEMEKLMDNMRLAVKEKDLITLRELSKGFHDRIVDFSGNPYLIKMVKQLYSLISFYRNIIFNNTERLEKGLDEHEQIWKAMLNKDGKAAEVLMRKHIELDYKCYISENEQD